MPKNFHRPLFATLGAVSLACAAQSPAESGPHKTTELVLMAQNMAGEALDFAAGQLRQEKVVKGAPYCAEAVHESVQTLPDASGAAGNRIVQRQTTRLCRDGEGRTRQEVERGGRKLVYLRDPVSRQSWVLDPEKKTARPLGLLGAAPHAGWVDEEAWHQYAERMRQWARDLAERMRSGAAVTTPGAPPVPPAPAAPPAPPAPPMPALITPGATGEHDARLRDVEVRVLRLDGSPGEPPPQVSWRARQFAPRGAGVLSSLGSKEIEGLRVNGERTTWTIEAGKLGNEKPIVITRDVWTSPELMLTVTSREFDPRSGEVLYRLQGIKRGEPEAALMQVPQDYSTPKRRRDAPPAKG